ncbi:MAG: beta-lactamase family protein [Anaerolineales bacterium]|nr:beta-lactamase family protein [Anaerolineales bacterium]
MQGAPHPFVRPAVAGSPAGAAIHALDQRLAQVVTAPGAELSGLAVAVSIDGNLAYEGYLGRRHIAEDSQGRDLPVTSDTRFRVASISKLFLALGVMRLAERRLLDLDCDVSDHLGFALRNPSFPERVITPRMLLCHTSSVRDGASYRFPLPATLASGFQPDGAYWEGGSHFAPPVAGIDTSPGKYFSYSNLGYGVLATLVEHISGERFDDYMANHVLQPLGLNATYSPSSLTRIDRDNLAALYRRQCGGVWNPEGPWCAQIDDYRGALPEMPDGIDRYRAGTNGTLFAPNGGLRATARELLEIIHLFLDGARGADTPLLKNTTIRAMFADQWRYDPDRRNGNAAAGAMRAWGLGLHHLTGNPTMPGLLGDQVVAGRSDIQLWGHLGNAYGLLGAMLFDPRRNTGLVYLIGGVSREPAIYTGTYSAFTRWEEQILSAIYATILQSRYA